MPVLMPLPFARAMNADRTVPERQAVVAGREAAKTKAVAKPAKASSEKLPVATKLPVASIFHEPWWLSAASDGTYEEVVYVKDNAVIGRMPYLRQRKIGWQTALVMPAMTHALGPSLSDLPGSERGRSLRRFTICGALIAQLPRAGHISFKLHRRETDALAFEAAGYTVGVRFTAEILPNTRDALWREMRDKTRNVIRRAEENLTIRTSDDPALFFDFYEENLRKRGLRNLYDRRLYANVTAACLERGRGRILFAVDAAGAYQSAIFTGWDQEVEYYLLSTRAPESSNGATSLLIWTALQEAASCGRIFDLDGIDSRTNHMLLTGFGGTLRPRYVVSQTSAAFHVARALRTGMATVFGRKSSSGLA